MMKARFFGVGYWLIVYFVAGSRVEKIIRKMVTMARSMTAIRDMVGNALCGVPYGIENH
uniref:Uncharacterized protein n=1 Tax=Candidatus Kentrum sp. FW TaxID=2126338 RepID=A0A450TSH6_9GAMM|nr:MAG: hypothetical protein BECKFW1821C_GA0114237_10274 [Candidatus Kentron sp. FW]